MNEDEWFKPKKRMPAKCSHEACESKVEWKKSSDECNALLDDHEIKEEEDETKLSNDESTKMKATLGKNNDNQVKTSNKKKHKIKLSKRLENDGIDHEAELSKSKKLEI